MSARARSEPQGFSKWPLEPAQSCRGARNGCSSPPRSRRGASNRLIKPFCRNRKGLRNCLFEFARCSKWMLGPVRLRWADRKQCSGLLGFAGAFKLAGRARPVSLGRSKCSTSLLKLTRRMKTHSKNCLKTLCSGSKSQQTLGSAHLHWLHGYEKGSTLNTHIYIYIYTFYRCVHRHTCACMCGDHLIGRSC